MPNTITDSLAVTGGVIAALTGNVTGDVTGNITGVLIAPTPTAYSGADAGTKAIAPGIIWATLTKGSAGTDYTLAAPGSGNIGKTIRVTSTGAHAQVVTVTGLLGGTTMTCGAAVANGFSLFAASATVWVVNSANGITQT